MCVYVCVCAASQNDYFFMFFWLQKLCHYYVNIYLIFLRKLFQITSTIILISIFHFYFIINVMLYHSSLSLLLLMCATHSDRMQISLDGLQNTCVAFCVTYSFLQYIYNNNNPENYSIANRLRQITKKKLRDVVIQQNRLAGGPLVFIIYFYYEYYCICLLYKK